MEIFELARQLGELLRDDARLVALNAAKEAYETNAELNAMMTEYNVQQEALQAEVAKSDRDMHLVETIQGRIDQLYHAIVEHPVFVELNRAQAEVNELMNRVNQTITTQITGEEPSECTHNCATCGGCH